MLYIYFQTSRNIDRVSELRVFEVFVVDIFDTAERGVSVFGGFAIVIFDTFIPVYLWL